MPVDWGPGFPAARLPRWETSGPLGTVVSWGQGDRGEKGGEGGGAQPCLCPAHELGFTGSA